MEANRLSLFCFFLKGHFIYIIGGLILNRLIVHKKINSVKYIVNNVKCDTQQFKTRAILQIVNLHLSKIMYIRHTFYIFKM